MKKIIPFILLSALSINIQAFALQETMPANKNMDDYSYENPEDLNFDNHSYYISDEQLEDAKKIDEIDEKSSFLQKIINSSHFSSDTATRTWIPINKVQN